MIVGGAEEVDIALQMIAAGGSGEYDAVEIILGAIITGLIVFLIVFLSIRRKQKLYGCPVCKKMNSYDKIDETEIRRTKISRPLDANGGRIYGERITYKVTYKCRICGNELTKTEYHDVY